MFPMSIAIQPQEGFSAPSLHLMVVFWLEFYIKVVTFLEQGQRGPSYSCRLTERQRRQHWRSNGGSILDWCKQNDDHLTCLVFLPVAIIMKSQYCLSSGTRMTTTSRSCEKIRLTCIAIRDVAHLTIQRHLFFFKNVHQLLQIKNSSQAPSLQTRRHILETGLNIRHINSLAPLPKNGKEFNNFLHGYNSPPPSSCGNSLHLVYHIFPKSNQPWYWKPRL